MSASTPPPAGDDLIGSRELILLDPLPSDGAGPFLSGCRPLPMPPLPDWLPRGWEHDRFPGINPRESFDGFLTAFMRWLDQWILALQEQEIAERDGRLPPDPDGGGKPVRDGYRLVQQELEARGWDVPEEPRGPVSSHDAVNELRRLRRFLEGGQAQHGTGAGTATDDDWQFHPGEAIYRGVRIRLKGIPLKILKALASAKRRAVTEDRLVAVAWPADALPSGDAVRSQVRNVREALRKSFDLDPKKNPVPCVDFADGRAWKLELPCHSDFTPT